MSFPVFCLFLILLQNRLTEQATEGPIDPATSTTSSSSENTSSTTETRTDSTSKTYDSSTNSESTENNLSTTQKNEETTGESTTSSRNIDTLTYTNPTTEGTTEDSTSYSRNIKTPSAKSTTELTTEESTTISTVTTKLKPTILSRALPDIVSTKSESNKSNEQQAKSYEKNFSTASVFGIVLGSLVGTVAVFYITVSLISKYRRKSYAVRSPSIELGRQA